MLHVQREHWLILDSSREDSVNEIIEEKEYELMYRRLNILFEL